MKLDCLDQGFSARTLMKIVANGAVTHAQEAATHPHFLSFNGSPP
jgi:hypothetical protein